LWLFRPCGYQYHRDICESEPWDEASRYRKSQSSTHI